HAGAPSVPKVNVGQFIIDPNNRRKPSRGFGRRGSMSATIAITVLSAAAILLAIANIVELRRRGRAERGALESERRYRLLAESSFDMIVRFDPIRQRRTYISPAVRRLYGYEPEEAMSISAEEVIHPADLPNVREALSQLEHGDVVPVTYRGKRKDGSY